MYVFFGKMYIQDLCPIINWVICLLVLSCMSSFYILDINPLLDTLFANIFFQSLLVLLLVSFIVQKLFSLM